MATYIQDKILECLGSIGWVINGSLDTTLEIDKSPPNSKLNAMVRIKNNGFYITSASLSAPAEDILRIRYYSTTRNEALTDLGRRVISLFEAYFTGNTNEKHILEVYRKYRRQPTL